MNAHNHHKISTERSATALQLFTVYMCSPLLNNSDDNKSTTDDWAADLPETSVVTVPRISCPLPAGFPQLLQATINPLAISGFNGKDLYLEIVQFVGRSILNCGDETV